MSIKRSRSPKKKVETPLFISQLRDNVIKAIGSAPVQDPNNFMDSVYGVPITDNLPLQYLLGIDVWALSRCASVVGPQGSTKSSFAIYLSHLFAKFGGTTTHIDTEYKTNPDQVLAIYQDNEKLLKSGFLPVTADSLEKMLDYLIQFVDIYKDISPKKDSAMLMVVDSLNAVTREAVSEDAQTMGNAGTPGFNGARNAGAIQQRMQVFVPKYLAPNPISAVIVNHQKTKISETGMAGFNAKHEPGGGHKDFAYTWKIALNKISKKTLVNKEVRCIKMKAEKSSLGPDGRTINVDYVSTHNEEGKELIWYDWDAALVTLLASKEISKTTLNSVMHLTGQGNSWNCNTLNLKNVTKAELGKAIHSDEQLVKSLQDNVLHIRRKRKFGC